MKRLLLSILFLACVGTSYAQIYVNASASGNNDGSSWDNAYTELSDAIANATEGDEIWVAAGVYVPGGLGAYRDTSFILSQDVSLYGGFSGTEASLNERADYKMNPTILSGDVDGDDIPGDFNSNRGDNCKHVIWTRETITTATTIDGFYIQNGHTDPDTASGDERRGGGMLSYGAPTVRNCTFTQNYGYYGGAAYPRFGDATGTRYMNCEFVSNEAGHGGAMYINSINAGLIMNCSFDRNTAAGYGGAVYNQFSLDSFINCSFTENAAGDDRGGAVYNSRAVVLYDSCSFSNNEALSSTGGALQFNAIGVDGPCQGMIRGCSFRSNASRWGACVTAYEDSTYVTIENSSFTSNDASTAGGAISVGFQASVSVDSCIFDENASASIAGAIFLQNDNSNITINNSALRTNVAENNGGAIATGSGVQIDIADCVFESNVAGTQDNGGFGGAISFSEDSFDLAVLNVERTQFVGNNATAQGGAMSIVDVNSNITNCLFAYNVGILRAGAISNNGTNNVDVPGSPMMLLNNTFASNEESEGNFAAGIVAWEDGEGGMASVMMQNNIFHNPGYEEIAIEGGDPEFISLGGNLSMNTNAAIFLDNDDDILGADPLFINPGLLDFNILPSSPCKDAGVNDGAPELDIRSYKRDSMVDIGCYEEDATNTDNRIIPDFEMLAYPTITTNTVWIQTEVVHPQENVILQIFNTNGILLRSQELPFIGNSSQRISLETLPSGMYYLRLITEEGIGGASVIKQ